MTQIEANPDTQVSQLAREMSLDAVMLCLASPYANAWLGQVERVGLAELSTDARRQLRLS